MLTTIGLILAAVIIVALMVAVIHYSAGDDFFTFWFITRPALEFLFQALGAMLVALLGGGDS